MDDFLLYIGIYNALGLPLLGAMTDERAANFLLRTATEVLTEKIELTLEAKLFLWWAATTNGALGALMLLSRGFPPLAQVQVAACVVGVYFLMWLVMLAGARGPRFGRGIWVCHGLWIGQMAWGAWAIWSLRESFA